MLRIVWLCPLNVIPYTDKVNFIKDKFPVVLAPWIDNYINALRYYKGLEVHIIAEFSNLKEDTYFNDENVYFHLLSQKMPFLNRGWPHIFRYNTNYFLLTRRVQKVLKKIKPDLIHLHGTEHDLSGVTLKINKIPVLVTIQGFLNEAINRNNSNYIRNKLKIENKILARFKNFGIRAKFMQDIIIKYNANPTFYYHDYIVQKPKYKRQTDYDAHVVFAARICRDKGIEDLIQALGIVKKQMPELRFKIIGSIDENYKKYLIKLLNEYDIIQNTNLIGFLSDLNDVHKEVAKSLINVLPTYYDIISGTIIESMFIGVPVIAYNVGAINELNLNRQSIIVLEKANINQLANAIYNLLLSSEIRNELSNNSIITMNEMFPEEEYIPKLEAIYNNIIDSFKMTNHHE